MTNQEKQLLLKDLCARLPYGVTCQFIWTYNNETTNGEDVIAKEDDNIKCINIHTKEIQSDYYDEWVGLEYCKPYLRSMSSMTEEEKKVYGEISHHLCGEITAKTMIYFLNAHHLDYNNLIPKKLALEAPEGMYK